MAFEIGKNALQLGIFFGAIVVFAFGKYYGNASAEDIAMIIALINSFTKQIQLGGGEQ
jgi:uncharacterized membrane protein YdjX (TVP38/TMEM64 family)